MSIILKYTLNVSVLSVLRIPEGSKLLDVNFQHDELQAWVLQPDNYQTKKHCR
ncbi:hypothetical protein KUL10_02350 [Glaciecola sp. KUL10]|nr:hypothetical protein KUL10_02350 [Glaciecola sp. KUL10]